MFGRIIVAPDETVYSCWVLGAPATFLISQALLALIRFFLSGNACAHVANNWPSLSFFLPSFGLLLSARNYGVGTRIRSLYPKQVKLAIPYLTILLVGRSDSTATQLSLELACVLCSNLVVLQTILQALDSRFFDAVAPASASQRVATIKAPST